MTKSFHSVLVTVRITLCALAGGLLSGCGGGGGNTQPSSPSDPGPARISLAGSVLDKSGAPVSGVSVSLFHTNQNTTLKARTDATVQHGRQQRHIFSGAGDYIPSYKPRKITSFRCHNLF